MAKRGRPSKADPRYLARKEAEREREAQLARLASGLNASGNPPGVNRTDTGMYQARITLEGKRINLGSFPSAEEAGQVYASAKAAGFTCKNSPKKNVHKRGTGLRSLATQTLMRYASCVSRCAIVSPLAGVKALKKMKGLAPRPMNMSYANAYGMPPTGFAFGEPLARPIANLPLAPAMPMTCTWKPPMSLAPQQQSAIQTQPQGAILP